VIPNPESVLPLVLLDVDGVINDLPASLGMERPWPHRRLDLGRATICIPLFVPPLLQYLDLVSDIWWCTTWGDMANQVLTPVLEIGPYPVVGADTDQSGHGWKARAAHPIATEAIREGRRVYWIEDFEGDTPDGAMPDGVTYVDTAAQGEYVLLPQHLPSELLPEGLQDLSSHP